MPSHPDPSRRRAHRPLALGLVLLSTAGWHATPAGAAPAEDRRPEAAADVELLPDGGRFIVQLREPGEVRPGQDLPLDRADVDVEVDTVLDRTAGAVVVEADHREAAALAADPAVESVEPDRTIVAEDVQSGAPWGLDRIDQTALPLDGQYTSDTNGAGVRVYIVDSGVRSDHQDFGGRVVTGYSLVADGRGTQDCSGHGTHVAGIAAGAVSGVAKGATIVPVRVLGCDGVGTTSSLVQALAWIRADRAGRPAVVNLSLSGPASDAIDSAVSALVQDGVPVVAAAGNGDGRGVALDACTRSPGRESRTITVGATSRYDTRSSFSNFGSCVDLFAPGQEISSASAGSTTGVAMMSGTSMAAPHVSGAIARLLQANPGASAGHVEDLLEHAAVAGAVLDAGPGSPNLLLHLGVPTPTGRPPARAGAGYWMLRRDGGLHAFGDALQTDGAGGPAVSLDAAPDRALWLLRADGSVVSRGTATDFGSVRPGTLAPGERLVSISALPGGDGYWVFTDRGRVLTFGSATHLGDMSSQRLNAPVIASVATTTGHGYYMVAADGGVFAFGDAVYQGSMGGIRLNQPVVGMAPAPSGSGYWLIASDGGVFAFGAPYRGSVPATLKPGQRLNQPVIGGIAYGNGYVMVASDGGAFVFSDLPFVGSLGESPVPSPVVGLTTTR